MRYLCVIFLSSLLLACGGGSSSDPGPGINPEPGGYAPEPQTVSEITLLDAIGQPLAGFSVDVSPAGAAVMSPQGVSLLNTTEDTFTTDGNGTFNPEGLAAGQYHIRLIDTDSTITLALDIRNTSAAPSITLAMPAILESDGSLTEIGAQGFIASFNGVVYNHEGPVAGAQISLSAGEASNGAFVSAETDEQGAFTLLVNVGSSLIPALQNVSLRIIHDNHEPYSLTAQDIRSISAISGYNHRLTTGQQFTGQAIYQETFDQLSAGATCGSWTASESDTLWHQHTGGLAIQNQALLQNLVQLAPDDTTEGFVPDPLSSSACWYGQAAEGIGQGNFLGTPMNNGDGTYGGPELTGGTSEEPNQGSLVSPVIDLRSQSTPLALTFRTWWEIESVNPNENGFDLLSIEYKEEGTSQWRVLARLNPLSDPVAQENRAAIPFSNRGYNRAPAWLWQEPISLDALAGKQVQLRFSFETVDRLYNGFRGWLLDDVRIIREAGTFPLWGGGNGSLPGGPLTLSDISPEPFDSLNPDTGALAAGSQQVFSLFADYDGDEDNVQIVMHYMSSILGTAPPQVASLPQGQKSGQLTTESLQLPAEETFVVLYVEVRSSNGVKLAENTVMYFIETD